MLLDIEMERRVKFFELNCEGLGYSEDRNSALKFLYLNLNKTFKNLL